MGTAAATAPFSALVVEGMTASGVESILGAKGCSVRRATSVAEARRLLSQRSFDLVVLVKGAGEGSLVDLMDASASAPLFAVVTDAADDELSAEAHRRGAFAVLHRPLKRDAAEASFGRMLEHVELRRRVARLMPAPPGSDTFVARRAKHEPLPREVGREFLDALVEGAENLVPLHVLQRMYVDYALRRFGGNKVHTATALGIDRRTIQRWARAKDPNGAS